MPVTVARPLFLKASCAVSHQGFVRRSPAIGIRESLAAASGIWSLILGGGTIVSTSLIFLLVMEGRYLST